MGFIDFSAGQVFTAAHADTLMQQSLIACTSTTRPASPAEGWHIYETDTDAIRVFDGTSWQFVIKPGAATTYTPAMTASTTSPTLGSGSTAIGHWFRVGPLVYLGGQIAFGTSGVNPGSGFYSISLPSGLPQVATYPALIGVVAVDQSTGQYLTGQGVVDAAATAISRIRFGDDGLNTTASTFGNAVPWTWAASDAITFSGVYLTSAA